MSAEISYQMQVLLNNDGLKDSFSSGSINADQSVSGLIRNVQEIGITDEEIQLGDVSVPGFAVFQNLDDTNFVEIGVGSFNGFLKIGPGEISGPIRLGTLSPRAQADSGAVKLFYIIYES